MTTPRFDLAAQVASLGADSMLPPERSPNVARIGNPDLCMKAAASIKAGACPCFRCIRERGEPQIYHGSRSCSCGNKRCPHASDHRLVCTGSNAPGQKGSIYE
jgi:hypothetical protein